MNYFLTVLFLFITGLQPQPVAYGDLLDKDARAHLAHSHHDNIADDSHEHSHKHGDGGEEHEHQHKHNKVSGQEVQYLSFGFVVNSPPIGGSSTRGFREKTFLSSPHPFEIFRPPIV